MLAMAAHSCDTLLLATCSLLCSHSAIWQVYMLTCW